VTLTPGPTGLPLDKINMEGATVSWAIAVPNAPSFTGKWDKESSSVKGSLSAPGGELPVEFKRTGEAKVSVPKESTAVSKQALGKWAGTLQIPSGPALRLDLTLANRPDGKGTATLVSLDQNNTEVPVASVSQSGNTIELDVRAVGARFAGTVNADGTAIEGTMNQNGADMPLKFTRPTAAPPPGTPPAATPTPQEKKP